MRAGESCQRFVLLESLFRLTHKRPPVRYLAHISSLRYVYVHFCYTVSKAYAYEAAPRTIERWTLQTSGWKCVWSQT